MDSFVERFNDEICFKVKGTNCPFMGRKIELLPTLTLR
jgi:hypothetical protein